jgi:hypothetical protein
MNINFLLSLFYYLNNFQYNLIKKLLNAINYLNMATIYKKIIKL